MHISFFCKDDNASAWLADLRAALPQAIVTPWQPGAALADIAVVWAPPQHMFDEQTQLRTIFNVGAGVDALMQLRLPPQALVVRLDDAGMAVQMAEYVCHAVSQYTRGFDRYQIDAHDATWVRRPPLNRAEFPVGILGLGVLGQRVAQALQHFEYPVLGWSRTPKAISGVRCYAGPSQLAEFLASSRLLVCLLPLTPETENILRRETLAQLQPGGYLINVARGAHLVDEDLMALIDSGHLAGAALDVFRHEPLPAQHAFWKHPKITLTPHTSARTLRDESIAQMAAKIMALERGAAIAGVVDRNQGY